MTQLSLVTTSPVSEKELVLRLIPKVGSEGSGHIGILFDDLNTLFRRQFGKPVKSTLDAMIEDASIVAALIVSTGGSYGRKSRLVRILDQIPKTTPKGKRIRIYLSDHVPIMVRGGLKRHKRLGDVLKEVLKA